MGRFLSGLIRMLSALQAFAAALKGGKSPPQ